MLNTIKREPALLSGLVAAVIALVTAFGLDLSNEQVGGIMAVVAALLAIVTRQSVTPNVSVAAQANPPGQPVAGEAANVPEGTPVDVTPSTELGRIDVGLLVFVAVAVLAVVGLFAIL